MVLMPPYEYKWTFKEGDVAVLSICMPGAGFANYFELLWVSSLF